MEAAIEAILLQADEIMVKPMDVNSLVHIVKERIATGPVRNREIVSVATILDRTTEATIAEWYERAEMNKLLMVRSDDLRTSLRSSASGLPGTGAASPLVETNR